MVTNYAVMYESNIDTKSSQSRAGFNQINNIARVYTPADSSIVTPNSDTQFGLTSFRTRLFIPADTDNIKKIQAGYKAQPLSAFLGATPPPAAPAIDWPAINKETATTDFFKYVHFVMQFIPAQPDDITTRTDIAKIGVEPGKPFDISKPSELDTWKPSAVVKAN